MPIKLCNYILTIKLVSDIIVIIKLVKATGGYIVNKEEILKKSRNDNKNGDERDLKNKEKAYSISAGVATLICIIIATIEEYVFKRSALDIWLIYATIEFATALSGAIFSKKKWLIGLSIFIGLILIAIVFFYIKENIAMF